MPHCFTTLTFASGGARCPTCSSLGGWPLEWREMPDKQHFSTPFPTLSLNFSKCHSWIFWSFVLFPNLLRRGALSWCRMQSGILPESKLCWTLLWWSGGQVPRRKHTLFTMWTWQERTFKILLLAWPQSRLDSSCAHARLVSCGLLCPCPATLGGQQVQRAAAAAHSSLGFRSRDSANLSAREGH